MGLVRRGGGGGKSMLFSFSLLVLGFRAAVGVRGGGGGERGEDERGERKEKRAEDERIRRLMNACIGECHTQTTAMRR